MFIKTKISTGIRGSINQHNKVKALLKAIDEQFKTSDKALVDTLIMKFSSLRLTNVRGVHEHIMQMRDIVAQLKTLKEGMLVMEMGETALLATQGKNQNQAKQKRKGYAKPMSANGKFLYVMAPKIEGKHTNKSKKGAKRSTNILEIIHLDICGPNMDLDGLKYFIFFIGNYSRYMYLYLLHNNNKSLDSFKDFKAEVENQCGKQIKIVRTDRDGEYYGKYIEDRQTRGPFAKFLQVHGIVA
ncbi:Retrovirus-related Pol polyprotein from transposon TNT 1-94 [Vitis vinifera]|uniref:Retrovirus-related Pol polyprotein from transposon TNT 1-94 n=1 Tax=Vitis vinifera TaxID=29760 RepID=A0A438HM33_VITVI|nr:Retrovirus-related Pol polyprotein from transposon TNT 1-94 [Vitis vinifera]